jgi:FlaA1/EpsC-like NDP-sugar epimerase
LGYYGTTIDTKGLVILIKLSRKSKQLVMILADSVSLVLILLFSFSLKLGYWYWPEDVNLLLAIFSAPIIAFLIFIRFGLYKAIIRFIGFRAVWAIVQAVSVYAVIWGIVGFMTAVDGIPRSVILINWFLALLVIGGSRLGARWLLSKEYSDNNSQRKNVVIYGAGSAGRQLSVALMQSNEYSPVAFLDDESTIHGHSINGLEVIPSNALDRLIENKNVVEVLLAIPSISRTRRNEIINFLEPYPVLVRSLPGVAELAQGKVKVTDLYKINIKDLLGRESVPANQELLSLNILDKVVMVTGAGGSIGTELCRQILLLKPRILILYEMNEFALYTIEKELLNLSISDVKILPILGSVNNTKRLSRIFKKFGVQTIYHAAAYKHVPMVEFNNSEGVSNNILGTLCIAQTAIKAGVEAFLLISTDKAVRPTNTMGATKRFAEMILQALSKEQNKTRFTMVRFGNVLDSSGSVIPLFKKQIKDGGPVTVTDKEIIRYFMTIPEAVELVIQASAMGKGGDVFVLDMGKPIRIVDLARKMIHLSGLQVKDSANPDGDIQIEYTGLRYGEKLYEELLIGDNVLETDNPMIMRAQEDMLAWESLKPVLDELGVAINNDNQNKIRELLIKVVPEFKPQCDIQDILYSNENNLDT